MGTQVIQYCTHKKIKIEAADIQTFSCQAPKALDPSLPMMHLETFIRPFLSPKYLLLSNPTLPVFNTGFLFKMKAQTEITIHYTTAFTGWVGFLVTSKLNFMWKIRTALSRIVFFLKTLKTYFLNQLLTMKDDKTFFQTQHFLIKLEIWNVLKLHPHSSGDAECIPVLN